MSRFFRETMVTFCPNTGKHCPLCETPCKRLEINPAATSMPQADKPFLGILAPLTETLGFEQTEEGINKITITTKL